MFSLPLIPLNSTAGGVLKESSKKNILYYHTAHLKAFKEACWMCIAVLLSKQKSDCMRTWKAAARDEPKNESRQRKHSLCQKQPYQKNGAAESCPSASRVAASKSPLISAAHERRCASWKIQSLSQFERGRQPLGQMNRLFELTAHLELLLTQNKNLWNLRGFDQLQDFLILFKRLDANLEKSQIIIKFNLDCTKIYKGLITMLL